MSVKESFDGNIEVWLGDGKRLLFWSDLWVGNSLLASQLLRLFTCARDWLAKACDCMVLNGDCINCGSIFRRYLTVIEEA